MRHKGGFGWEDVCLVRWWCVEGDGWFGGMNMGGTKRCFFAVKKRYR
jgi:hypothetical protein